MGPSDTVRATTLHRESLVLDAHTDTLQRVVMEGADLGRRSTADSLVERADLPRYREGGVNAQIFAVWVDTIYVPDLAAHRALEQIDGFHRVLASYPEQIALARTAAEVRAVVESARLAALLSIEGGDAIENDLALLRTFQRLGASSMTLCHSRSTDWVDSSTDSPRWGGLNEFGREVIAELNRLKMLVDVSHASDDAVRDTLAVSTAPVIASHSSCRALNDHPRNLSDELLRGIADRGGVIGINFFSGFLDQSYLDAFQARNSDVLERLNAPQSIAREDLESVALERLYSLSDSEIPRPGFDVLLDHVDHAVSVAGIDAVGLGTDLDVPRLSTPEGFDDVTDFPLVTRGLVARGYSDASIRKILGENFLRVLGEVTEAAG